MISDIPPKIWMPEKPAIIRRADRGLRPWTANFLPGMFPGGALMAGAVVFDTLSFINSSTSTGASITMPSSIDAGDALLYFDSARDSSSPPGEVTPSGFTNFISFTGGSGANQMRAMISRKIADGTEDSSSITGMDGKANSKVVLQFRGNISISTITPQDIATEGTTGDPVSQTCNASGGAVPLIVFGLYGSSSAISPRTFSPAQDGEVSPSNTMYVKYKIYNASPADHTISMEDEGSANMLSSFYLEAA